MNRKKWTPKTNITEEVLKFREKRKWQLALRRYVLEKNPGPAYARYFGLGIEKFKRWIALQFEESMTWENFGTEWQFDHLLPLSYFDFSSEADLLLCWNFINIRVSSLTSEKANRAGLISAKAHFAALYERTGYAVCLKMLEKITIIERAAVLDGTPVENFIIENKAELDTLASFTGDEFYDLNTGTTIKDILLQRRILEKFG